MSRRTLSLSVIGRTVVRLDGGAPVAGWPRPSARRLVVLLALAPRRRRSRDWIAEQLFAHLAPERSARAVSKSLSMARSVLAPDVLTADRTNIWIADDVTLTCDLVELLDSLRRAVDDLTEDGVLGGGMVESTPPSILDLADEVLADDRYEQWTFPVRDELERLARGVRMARAETSGSTEAWDAVARHDPSNERACRELARAASAAGDREAIVRAFERCRGALGELGLAAPPDLVAEIESLVVMCPAPVVRAAPAASQLRGREREVDQLVRALEGESARRGSCVVIGPAGVGKTRLQSAVADALRRAGWLVASGTAVDGDRLAPMAALRTALRRVVPEGADPLSLRAGASAWTDPGDAAADVSQVADEVGAALAALAATRPVLLAIDDVQWCDPALQRLLVRLAARPDRSWALLVGGRSDESGAPVPAFGSAVVELAVGPLPADAAAQIVRDEIVGCDEAVVESIVDRARGNPFFVVELARQRVADGRQSADGVGGVPERISRLLAARVGRLGPAARDLLELIAVLGDDATYGALAADGDDRTGELVAELIDAALLRETGGGPRLAHPLLGDAVLDAMAAPRRAQLHSQAALAVEQDRSIGGRDRVHLAVGRHRVTAFVHGGRLPRHAEAAARAGFIAGGLAARLAAAETEQSLLAGALDAYSVLDGAARDELSHAATSAWIAIGDHVIGRDGSDVGEAAYRCALDVARAPADRARCWSSLHTIPYRVGDWEAAASMCRDGIADIGADDPLAIDVLEVDLGWILHRQGADGESLAVIEPVAGRAEEAGDWELAARALDYMAVTLSEVGRLDESLDAFERASAACDRTGNRYSQAVIAIHHGAVLAKAGRRDDAIARLEGGTALSDALGNPYTRSVARWIAAEAHDRFGELDAALAARDTEVALLEPLANHAHLAAAHAHRADLLRRLARPAAAIEAGRHAVAAARRSGDSALLARIEAQLAATSP